jgi:predicted dehydrogenase
MPSATTPLALAFLDPGHFHAALTLGAPNPSVRDDILVYAPEGPELADFLALVESFNGRPAHPTAWRPMVRRSRDPLADLLTDGKADAVVIAGRTAGKLARIRALHDAGLPVLADKPWLVGPEDLDHARRVLSGPPLAMEMMTGRHDAAGAVLERVVADDAVFGGFAAAAPGRAPIELGSVHHLAKVVNGAPLRRPPWYFDVRVQGDGLADIPTHLVDRAQRLVAAARAGRPEQVELVSARAWPTAVPREVWRRVTGLADFPAELAGDVRGDALHCRCNAELHARVGGVAVSMSTRWDLVEPPGGGDAHTMLLRGARATVRVEQTERTAFRRRIWLADTSEQGAPAGAASTALADAVERAVRAWHGDLPGLAAAPGAEGIELVLPAASGHESHFALVLREFVDALARGDAMAGQRARTLAKYALLAEAIGSTRR